MRGVCLILFLLFTNPGWAFERPALVQLNAHAFVEGDRAKLVEIARVVAQQEAMQVLEQIEIDVAGRKSLEAEAVRQLIADAMGERFHLVGPGEVRLTRVRSFPFARLVELAREAVVESHPLPPGRLELIGEPGGGRKVKVQAGDAPLVESVSRRGDEFDALVAAGSAPQARRYRLAFRIKGARHVSVAADDLRAGLVLGEPHVRREAIPEIPAGCQPVSERHFGMRLISPVRAGDVLCRNALRHRLAVEAGDQVRVTVVGKRVRLEVIATARHAGHTGTRVRFMSTISSQPFDAYVTGPRTAQLEI